MVDVTLPKWGATMQEGTLTAWLVKVGDRISEDDPVAEIQTEKVNADVEAPSDGVIVELLVEEGATVPVGAVLARIDPS